MLATQILAGSGWALLIFVSIAPGLNAYAKRIRVGILIAYLVGFVGLAIHVLFR